MKSAFWLAFLMAGTALASSPEELEPEVLGPRAHTAYDLPIADYEVTRGIVAEKAFLAELMIAHGAEPDRLPEVVDAARGVFDVRRIRAGRPYLALSAPDSEALRFFIYEESELGYVVFDFDEDIAVYRGQKLMHLRESELAGTIVTSLYDALAETGSGASLTRALADIFGRKIDFRDLRKGDRFKVIFEQQVSGDTVAGLGRIKAAWMAHDGEEYYAFLHELPHEAIYLDEHGIGLRTTFLRSPIKGGRISSNYTRSRFHPIQKRYKPHLGTDYAAPAGTEILALSDGVVTEARYARHNGNYVKLDHGDGYETQYLHMTSIADGLEPGSEVTRGQVIGYVGETGLAVGPHVCLRFWKNGRQVDFRHHRHLGAEVGRMLSDAEMTAWLQPLHDRLARLSFEAPATMTQGIAAD